MNLIVNVQYDTDEDRIAFVSLAEDRLCVLSLTNLPAESGFLVGRLLLLKFVEELLGEAAPLNDDYRQNGTTQVVLGYNSFGKPFLVRCHVCALSPASSL
jgi:hypothetical protein